MNQEFLPAYSKFPPPSSTPLTRKLKLNSRSDSFWGPSSHTTPNIWGSTIADHYSSPSWSTRSSISSQSPNLELVWYSSRDYRRRDQSDKLPSYREVTEQKKPKTKRVFKFFKRVV